MSADPAPIPLESYELVLLRRTRRARELDEETIERIFGEHLAYTVGLVSGGQQLAAGPVRDSPAEEEHICGMGLFRQGSLDRVRELANADPGVRQGLYRVDVMLWQTPAGRITFPGPPQA
jgi:YCII-related domain-containing protein